MAASKDEIEERRRRQLYLTIGGVLSLVLPLLGLAYLKLSDNSPKIRASTGAFFSQRQAGSRRSEPSPVVAPPVSVRPEKPLPSQSKPAAKAAPSQDSMSFIRGGSDYYPEEKPAASAAPPKPKPAAPAKPPKKEPSRQAKKSFAPPKLKPVQGFSNFRGQSGAGLGTQAANPQVPSIPNMLQMPAGAQVPPNVQEMLKNIPGAGSGQ
ncbi:MAG: hypothetical protein HY549_10670 [Elusimicrobia bacterium]|nr:hypothetical protein [Elusimicrobiota bacterium]